VPLDPDKRHERDRGEGEEADDQRVGPAQAGPLIERDEECDEADREGCDPAVVDAVIGERPCIRADDAPGDQHRDRGDGKVQEEDPAPTERVGQDASEERSDRVPEAGGAGFGA
jgi:hypothetical protein